MGIRVKIDYGSNVNKDLIAIEKKIIEIMQVHGEIFVKEAKKALNISSSLFPKGNYGDRTDNLRSSIGYFVLRDNEIVFGDGNMDAQLVLSSIPQRRGYRLIGVAGMDYASYVESKGYNVITSQQEVCLANLNSKMQKFAKSLGKKGMSIDFETSF